MSYRLPLQVLATALLVACTLAGCVALLPRGEDQVQSPWTSYDDAVRALARFEPYKSTRSDVHRDGLDPAGNASVRVLHFADLMQRFGALTQLPQAEIEQGLRDCLRAGKQCTAYAVQVRKVDRKRVGSFWLDSLNFKRETEVSGWSVDALLVFVDDLMVYQVVGGQPSIHEREMRRNPLGPLQGWGETLRP